jgi:hypothetical protein
VSLGVLCAQVAFKTMILDLVTKEAREVQGRGEGALLRGDETQQPAREQGCEGHMPEMGGGRAWPGDRSITGDDDRPLPLDSNPQGTLGAWTQGSRGWSVVKAGSTELRRKRAGILVKVGTVSFGICIKEQGKGCRDCRASQPCLEGRRRNRVLVLGAPLLGAVFRR